MAMLGCLAASTLNNKSFARVFLLNFDVFCDQPGHLFDYGDVLLLPLDPGEAVEVVLQRLDLLVQLELGDDVPHLGLGAATELAAHGLQVHWVGVRGLNHVQQGGLGGLWLSLWRLIAT